ncbi:MAG: NAD(P)-dependent oxidoreductase [Rhodothalassiaceae bacterium]
MLRFVDVDQATPDKRAAEQRRSDFGEIYRNYAQERAAEQAARCSQCGVPFCQVHCPLNNHIPDWLMLCAEDRLEEAYRLSAQTNPMPEICGRICPQDRLCEGNCVIEKGFGSVTIGAVEQYLTETAFQQGWVEPIRPRRERPGSIGIIGAGPGGLAAAEGLRKRGFQVDVYDRYDRIGGLLVYGIPNFKLDKQVVQRRADRLIDGGIRFHLNTEVGRDISFEAVRASHDAVIVATGAYQARDLKVPGIGLTNVLPAMRYLTASNRHGLGDAVPDLANGSLNAAGKRVVVIGGGDTAMDCVRTAVRQGADAVTCLYRRDRANMPGSAREVANAEEEGVVFSWLSAPEALLGDDKVEAVRVRPMRLGAADATGRKAPQPVPGPAETVPADMVILALGFDPEDLPGRFGTADLAIQRWGTLKVDHGTQMTSLPGVFAVGDIVRGASLVVWAVRDGRDVVDQVQRYLAAKAPARAAA